MRVATEGSDPIDTTPLDALRTMRDDLWDDDQAMDRYAPGVAPGVDLASLNLHASRETVLGAFLDLTDGRVDRAIRALRSVLALQYPVDGSPWSGTFPVAAETPPPPGADAVEWVHYDPNWRQFIGCALAMCRIVHAGLLPDDVLAGIAVALDRCVAGEPDGRIPRWYTNPNLMQAWLQGHVGATTGDNELVGRAHERVALLLERFQRYGDIDEYNSPTYDGIDLWALGLWATHPPTAAFGDAAATMLPAIGGRISTLYHPGFGVTCGPYIRAYGLDPTTYVSLSGLLLSVIGEPPARVLPSPIDADTDHVHDLYFLPVLDHVAPALAPHVAATAVESERSHLQRFRNAVAEHLLRSDLAVGWERGRRHAASLDQYVPFVAHVAEADGATTALGIMVPPETAWIDVERTGDLEFRVTATGRADQVGLRLVGAPADLVDGAVAHAGRFTLRFDEPPATATGGHETHLGWTSASVTATVTIADRR